MRSRLLSWREEGQPRGQQDLNHPKELVELGSIQRGNDKASIPRGFAEFLIQRIREISLIGA
jgi:hypothetical protein